MFKRKNKKDISGNPVAIVKGVEELENVLRSWDPGDSIDCIEEVHISVLEDQISMMQTANHLLLIQDYTKSFPSALCMMGYMEAIRRLLHGSGSIAKLLMIDASVDMEIVSLVISCLGLHWTNELEEIVVVSAGVMITRGDLGVEIRSKKMEAPVLFKGIGPSISPASNLVLKVLSASAAAYSSNLKSKLSVPPTLTGSGISLVSVVQARNNARLLISGSLIMFSEFFRSGVQKAGSTTKHEKCWNEQFFSELSKWVFHERGHHKVGEAYEPSMYRIKDDLDYSVEVYEWSGTSWEPYVADDMQVQFYMMSPYVLQTLTTGNLAKPISSCACCMELKSLDPRGRGSSSGGGIVMAYVYTNYGGNGVKKERSILVFVGVNLVKNTNDELKYICCKFSSLDPRGRGSYQPGSIVMYQSGGLKYEIHCTKEEKKGLRFADEIVLHSVAIQFKEGNGLRGKKLLGFRKKDNWALNIIFSCFL